MDVQGWHTTLEAKDILDSSWISKDVNIQEPAKLLKVVQNYFSKMLWMVLTCSITS